MFVRHFSCARDQICQRKEKKRKKRTKKDDFLEIKYKTIIKYKYKLYTNGKINKNYTKIKKY